ncbi:dephospho-CoA kinase [Capnocytophaga gingivalis]|jgi:dephospho-coA kinase|uniref:Dephospho-CoA kinase n=1 Tax=Capnocytophaga gingivalis TaxID=1017 RepID=A0A250FLJ9_9FLAO|nr:dephospho-CoA kinase [Capnocytophaga gingivalis]ATA85983.1 dephospho-CoA kinase [Capnocytophaga gingivalis]
MIATVGLTGGIGSGKTTIANLFALHFSIPIYIADTKAKELVANNKQLQQEIVTLLGEEAFVEGRYNTAFVAQEVFSNKDKLDKLNAIIHPYVQQDFLQWKQSQQAPYVIKEAAILFESGFYRDCDFIIMVTAPLEERIKRVMLRDKIDRETVEKRIKNQWNDEKKIELSTFVIENREIDKNLDKIEIIHSKIVKMTAENVRN